MTALSNAVRVTFERWGSDARPDLSREDVGKMLGIGLGLDGLFNGSPEAERHWMQTPHSALKTRPITMVLAGQFDAVLDQVNRERNLY